MCICDKNKYYSIPENISIRYYYWDDEAIIYNELTGDTHLLDRASADIVVSLSKQSVSRRELLNKLSVHFTDAIDLDLECFLDDLILRLQDLNLLEIEENQAH